MSALTVTGLVVFGVGYAPALVAGTIAAAVTSEDDSGASVDSDGEAEKILPLLVPVAGPLITGALIEPTEAQWLVLGASAATQAAGLTLVLIGLAVDDGRPASSELAVFPIVVGDAGIGLAGRF